MPSTPPSASRVVIVGASLGGLRAAESIRGAGFDGELVVVGAEAYLPYNRPPLSKEALASPEPPDAAALAFRRRASVDDVRWLTGRTVVAAALPDGSRSGWVELDDGSRQAADGLVAASGLRPRRLDLPGPATGRHTLRTVDDAAALRRRLGPGRRLVVLGAGFIGCEVAATARGLGCEVEVVAPEQVPMQRPLGIEVGAALARRHEGHGVRFRLGRRPVAFEESGDGGRVGRVLLDDGSVLEADLVLEALGCLPNVEWLTGTGVDLTDGVLTDGWLRALGEDGAVRPSLVAVGDLARYPNALFDDVPRRVEHWSNPTDTARRAGPALVAHLEGADAADRVPAPFAPMPSFWTDQFDVRLQSFGVLSLADEVRLLDGEVDGEFVVGYLRDGALVGVVGAGMMATLMTYRAKIAAR